jgi:cyclopropane fatty-acyl-phospholipid synthase-like methyltransferase
LKKLNGAITIQTPRNWSRILFVENPELYLPFLKNEVRAAEKEVQDLRKIFKLYGVNENCKILDLSCGIGRHSICLAQAGYNVVGSDPSEFYLEYARQWASSQKENLKGTLKFFSAEPSEVSKELLKVGEKDFNVVISMFQSFGYRSIRDDIAHFRDILKIASQNCILIIQSENKEWRIRNFQKRMSYEFNNLVVVEKWTNRKNSDVFQACAFLLHSHHHCEQHAVLHRCVPSYFQ